MAGESGSLAAGAFYPGTPHGAKAFRPAETSRNHFGLVRSTRPGFSPRWSTATATWTSRCVSTPKITSTLVSGLWVPRVIVTCVQLLSMSRSLSTRRAGEHGRYCDWSRQRRAPMRSRRLRPRAAVGRHQGVRSTSHLQGTFGSPGKRVRPVQGVAHSHSPVYSQPRRGILRTSAFRSSEKFAPRNSCLAYKDGPYGQCAGLTSCVCYPAPHIWSGAEYPYCQLLYPGGSHEHKPAGWIPAHRRPRTRRVRGRLRMAGRLQPTEGRLQRQDRPGT